MKKQKITAAYTLVHLICVIYVGAAYIQVHSIVWKWDINKVRFYVLK